ncbi:MAG: 3-deoxy-manno-octulosonate cytidylyltransferase [Proteobacteria bacterium]|nr:3-deoxy-manno-octulosonate cytidylyltransferase [Pseudomonadota bacterium]MBU1686517.1 3-deoxy-manno-octulosonate cytidylyltransferase [Pseudomonadota bacterium]
MPDDHRNSTKPNGREDHTVKKLPPCYGVIPARYASSRFEGKPLVLIHGKPMFWHVYTRARRCSLLTQITLATDDQRIFEAAVHHNVPVLMTSDQHRCGTERVLEAATMMKVPDHAVIINIQGDEPTLEPDMLFQLIQPFTDSSVQVTTLARPITHEEALNPDQVKVVVSGQSDALYFSRSPIPYPRDGENDGYLGHIGIYAFRMKTLREYVALDSSVLEKKEKLEQLRLLENGYNIRVVETEYVSYGVDRPEDIALIEEVLSKVE